ncbi:OmpA family protein [Pedobacter sp. PLR]|uniref:OmpA family protein n=1 Tax=Pedobacter sp. PLR TaxID=2994465 RepID=UPI0022483E13|nr:OmpA family protein [Pedobacter sp. PLR]MCX2453857.1 OmpA family protein [Pedobacter sp. PLR]
MKKNLLISLSALLLMLNLPLKAQYVLYEADELYRLSNYIKAIDLYEQAYKKKKTLRAAERLAEGYSITKNYVQAESWYAIAAGMPAGKPRHVLGYAQALLSNSKYREARQQFQRYIDLKGKVSPKQKELWLQSCDSAVKWMQNPVPVQIQNAGELNSIWSDWGAVKLAGNTIFTSDREHHSNEQAKVERSFLKFDVGETPDKKVYGRTGNQYLRLYQKLAGNDSLQLFPVNAGDAYHVGAASFGAEGEKMFFSLTRIPEKLDYRKGNLATVNVGVYTSDWSNEERIWKKPLALNFNNISQYAVGDPFISKDGKTLYFVSNMPGGKGGTDIYITVKNDAGNWTVPVNFYAMNTEYNERSPFLDEVNDFYFSSDGYVGMGGLDIFMSSHIGDVYGKPVNLGYPFNSAQDDFAFNIGSDGGSYLSSNRIGGLGSDDIYTITRQVQTLKLEGRILNRKTGLPVAAALATLKTRDGNILKVQTDEKGSYSFKIDPDIPYAIIAEKINFQRADSGFITKKSLIKDFYLTPVEINKAIRLENIYYDFNKWNIREDAVIELDKLLKILKDNPTIWIEIGSYTDSRGNDAFNRILSQNRAASVIQYLISRGIDKNRLTAHGYGESELLNHCTNEVSCSETEHQLNRRTEFKIVKQ